MKYLYVIGCALFLTACGKSLTYQEVEALKAKCEAIGGTVEYRREGTVAQESVSFVDCKANGILFRDGKY